MRLSELNPKFYMQGAYEWLDFECPRCKGQPVPENMLQHTIQIPVDPSHPKKWDMTGRDFEKITVSPSILDIGRCGVHFFIRNGGIVIA